MSWEQMNDKQRSETFLVDISRILEKTRNKKWLQMEAALQIKALADDLSRHGNSDHLREVLHCMLEEIQDLRESLYLARQDRGHY